MAAKQSQMSGDGFTSHIAGMSKSQLYDIMSQMKNLIEQNQQQARQILIDNPLLTRALFQAQIMLGMVQPSHVTPNVQQALSQPQSAQVEQQPNIHQPTQSFPVQSALHDQTSSSQPLAPTRQQHQTQTTIPLPSSSIPSLAFQSQATPSNPPHSSQQAKGFLNAQAPPVSLPQSSQIHNLPLPPPPGPPHYSILQSHMPIVSSQTQPSLQTPGVFHQPLQPHLPQQPRQPSMQPFSHQIHSQMPHSLGFQQSSGPQQLQPQSLFRSGSNPPSSFPQGPPPLPNQLLPQQLYQGGSHQGSDYSNQSGSSMQIERGAQWAIPGLPEKATSGSHLLGPPTHLVSGHMGPPRPPPLTPDMEKALLQQVMTLTPEQINLLPPEQRQQVIQLQEMLK